MIQPLRIKHNKRVAGQPVAINQESHVVAEDESGLVFLDEVPLQLTTGSVVIEGFVEVAGTPFSGPPPGPGEFRVGYTGFMASALEFAPEHDGQPILVTYQGTGGTATARDFNRVRDHLQDLRDAKADTASVYTRAEADTQFATAAQLGDKADTASVYTRAEADTQFATAAQLGDKADTASVYTRAEADALFVGPTQLDPLLAAKADVASVYTRAESDTQFATAEQLGAKADTASVYTRTEADAQFATAAQLGDKADVASVYTRAETDAQFATAAQLETKADVASVYTRAESDTQFATAEQLGAKADTASIYTRTEADALFVGPTQLEPLLAAKADVASVYTRAESDTQFATAEQLGAKADTASVYTRTEADGLFVGPTQLDPLLAAKADVASVYTRAESDTQFATAEQLGAKADTASVYTRTEADAQFVALGQVFTRDEADARFAALGQVFTRDEADARFAALGQVFTRDEADARFAALGQVFTRDEADGRFARVVHAHPFAALLDRPATLAGYGITDAMDLAAAQTVGGEKRFTGSPRFKNPPAGAPALGIDAPDPVEGHPETEGLGLTFRTDFFDFGHGGPINNTYTWLYNQDRVGEYPFWAESVELYYRARPPEHALGVYELLEKHWNVESGKKTPEGQPLWAPYRPMSFDTDLNTGDSTLRWRLLSLTLMTRTDEKIVDFVSAPGQARQFYFKGPLTAEWDLPVLTLRNLGRSNRHVVSLFSTGEAGHAGESKVGIRSEAYNSMGNTRTGDLPVEWSLKYLELGRPVHAVGESSGLALRGRNDNVGFRSLPTTNADTTSATVPGAPFSVGIKAIQVARSNKGDPKDWDVYQAAFAACNVAFGIGSGRNGAADRLETSLFAGGVGVVAMRNVARNRAGVGPNATLAPQLSSGLNPVGGYVEWAESGRPNFLTSGGKHVNLDQSAAIPHPVGGAVVDAECRAALAALLAAVRERGLVAP
jgi:hypothetical protein